MVDRKPFFTVNSFASAPQLHCGIPPVFVGRICSCCTGLHQRIDNTQLLSTCYLGGRAGGLARAVGAGRGGCAWFRLVRSPNGPVVGGRGGGGGGGFCPGAPKYFVIESSSFLICAEVAMNTCRYLLICSRRTSTERRSTSISEIDEACYQLDLLDLHRHWKNTQASNHWEPRRFRRTYAFSWLSSSARRWGFERAWPIWS